MKMWSVTVIFLFSTLFIQSNGKSLQEMVTHLHLLNSGMKEQQALQQILADLYNSPELRRTLSNTEGRKRILRVLKSSQCQVDVEYAFSNSTTWGAKMVDATGKPPSSLLDGALHWPGGYQQCVNAESPTTYNKNVTNLKSHYCRASLYSPALQKFIAQPVLILVLLGVCVPESCNPTDVWILVQEIINEGRKLFPYIPQIYAVGTDCLVPQEELKYSTAAIAMLVVCGVIGVLLLIGTAFDLIWIQRIFAPASTSVASIDYGEQSANSISNHQYEDDRTDDNDELVPEEETEIRIQAPRPMIKERTLTKKDKFLVAFSVYTNAMKIFDTTQQPGRLNCMDGIRFLSMSWVILGHTYLIGMGVINNIFYIFPQVVKHWTNSIVFNGYFSVDSFFVLSGLLTAYTFLCEVHRIGRMNAKVWITYFLHRFWRLTPTYMLFLGLYTSLTIHVSNGPFWNQAKGIDMDNCNKTWWHNLLYINNFYRSNESCMGWSWYLANDMQFHYIVAPLILVVMFFFGMWCVVPSLMVVLASLIATGVIARGNPDTLPDLQENVYLRPWCRVSPYVVGLVTGYLIFESKRRRWKLHWSIVVTGWIVAAGFCLSTLYGLSGITRGSYTVSKNVQAFYTSTHRFAWSLGIAWLIYACVAGYGGWINRFLSWKVFIPLSRLTYCAYLVHLVVIAVFYMSLPDSPIVSTMTLVYWFIGHLVVSYMVAFVLAVSCESPLIGLERILRNR